MKASDIAYEKIKRMIMTCELVPGEVIVESTLQDRLEMGRTPIREALNRLSWEHQVRIVPRQCIMVSDLHMGSFRSIFEFRYALSSLEGKLAAQRRSGSDIEKLHVLEETIGKTSDAEERVFLDRDFHRAISAMTRNEYLENEMNMLLDLSVRLLFLNREQLDGSIDSSATLEYEAMIDALTRKDGEKLSQLEQAHVVAFGKKFLHEGFSAG